MCNFYLINKQNLFATGGQLGTGTIQLMMISGLFLVVKPFKDELNSALWWRRLFILIHEYFWNKLHSPRWESPTVFNDDQVI